MNPSLSDSKLQATSLHILVLMESPLCICHYFLPLVLYVFGFHDSILSWLSCLTVTSPSLDYSLSPSVHFLDNVMQTHDFNCNQFADSLLLPCPQVQQTLQIQLDGSSSCLACFSLFSSPYEPLKIQLRSYFSWEVFPDTTTQTWGYLYRKLIN